ncbi:MAG: RsmB/NOP family class I SAM-dependent RNA methyltransferase [Victivallaceae bacterium]|nr:RsmB/NOP family class I SAM-dependent RNA methyltransferase [Victivallaceae bacterium]
MDVSPGKFRARMAHMEEALRVVLGALFGGKLPPDRALNDFFRAHRGCGSHDRKMISGAVFAVCRYWGWLRLLCDETLRAAVEKGENVFSRREIVTLGCGALFIAHEETESREAMRRELELPVFGDAAEAEMRAGKFAAALGIKKEFPPEALLPDFVLEKMDPALNKTEFLRTLMHRPPMWLRVRAARREKVLAQLRENGIGFEASPQLGEAVAAAPSKVNLFTLTSFRDGDFEVQDLASQAIGRVCGAVSGQRWFDVCAGAGGKTLLLAEMMRNRGTILAGDVRLRALEILRLRARRAGYGNIAVKVHDGAGWKGRHPFDGVLVDAPCSGSGVWRRNPGCPWRFDPAEIGGYAARQRAILDGFSSAVKCGGVLVYSTCSLFPEENQEQVAAFLARHPGFELEDFPHPLTGEATGGMMLVQGEKFDCDWMFSARFRRKV